MRWSSLNEQNVRKIGIRRSLKELRNYDCVLLDPETRKCRGLRRPTAAMPHLAFLGFQPGDESELGSEPAKFVLEAAKESSTSWPI